jgi:thioredoxin 2
MHLACPTCGTTNRIRHERLNDGPLCGRCATPLIAAEPVNLSDAVLSPFIAGGLDQAEPAAGDQ